MDDLTIEANLKRARATWGQIHHILSSDGASPTCMARFYMTIVQSVLLFGSETWVLSQCMLRRLNSFHYRCARYMAHQHIRQLPNGDWHHPDMNVVLETCHLRTLQEYINIRKTRLLHRYAEPHLELYQQCLSLPMTNNRRSVWWNSQ